MLFRGKHRLLGGLSVLILALVVLVGIWKGGSKNNQEQGDLETKVVIPSCSRTQRLDNSPAFDRALSLINEKYAVWEEGGERNFGSLYFFPSKLTNCIKIVEEDVRNSTDAEGYFVFNDDNIESDYFPIYVDSDYLQTDDLVTALLLVHEITHVRQYLDTLNGVQELSCIDNEVEAFDAAYNFGIRQFGENEKTIELRTLYDEDLHPQLQTLNTIKNSFGLIRPLTGPNGLCEGASGNECTNRINQDRRSKIKEIVAQQEIYKEQCGL
jgi:hypothetical protein